MSKENVRVGILNFVLFILINSILNITMFFVVEKLHLSAFFSASRLFIGYLLLFLLYFIVGFILGMIQFKIAENEKNKIISLTICFVFGASVLSIMNFVIIQAHSFMATIIYVLFNALCLFFPNYTFLIPVILLFFFVLGIFVQNLAFSKKTNIKKMPQIIYNEKD